MQTTSTTAADSSVKPEVAGYFMTVAAGPGVRARVSINSIPAYFISTTMPAATGVEPVNHFLMPGRNSMTVEVELLPAAEHMSADLRRNHDHKEELARYVTTRPCDRREDAPPYGVSHMFDIRDPVSAPWLEAPPAEFGSSGTPGQRQVLKALHGALESADADAFLDVLATKFAGLRAVYGHPERLEDTFLRQRYRAAMASGCRVEALSDDLVYQSCHDGRIACVVRRTGDFALRAKMGRAIPFRTNVYLRHDGADRWTVLW
ncbi:MAG: hypothetical protein U0271_38905 [Polyangiaceae bacterium]